MATNPFDQFDNSTNPFNQFDTPSAGSTSTFKSGDYFHDTLDLIKQIPHVWDQLKKEWGDDKSLADVQKEYAKASPVVKAAMQAKLQNDVASAHAAGSAALDTMGALPAMAVGGVAGIGSAALNLDASKGLQTGGKVMNSLMPSSLIGSEDDQKKGAYQAVMAPYTAMMDSFNAIPQTAGEAVNAAGFPNAAGQVTDAGKLAIMATLGAKGAHEAYKGVTKAPAPDSKLKIEDPRERQEPTLNSNPFDQFDSTVGHADDFAAMNPYDVGGHVSASEQGAPSTIDNAQGDLFGGQSLEPAQPAPDLGQASIRHDTIPYEKTFPFDLEPMDKQDTQAPMGLNMPEVDQQSDLSLAPMDKPASWASIEPTPPNAMASAMKDAQTDYTFRQRDQEAAAKKAADEQAAYQEQERKKQADYARMEAQRELDHMNMANSVESTPGRNFFTDPANRDKLDLHDITDSHGYAKDALGDKSMMEPEHTQSMVDALRRGDINGALDVIMNAHNNVAYRKLADYLRGNLDNIKVRVHDEGIMEIGDRHATGYFDPETGTVGLSGVGAVSPHTVLHELVHAMTSDFVNQRPNDMRVLGLKDLYNKLNELGMQKEFPSITNVKEFLAESFSNPEFQDFLKEHKLQDRSTWRRFVDNVKSLLGFSSATRNEVTNALEHVMDLGKQVMDAKDSPAGALKDAGLPGKLADLMVTREPQRPNMVRNNENMEALKGLGKIKAQFDFTPLKPEDVIKLAKQAEDIPKGHLETIKANLDAGGRFASLRHNNNPVIKYTFAYMDQAIKNYEKWVGDNITNKQTGIKSMLRGLSEDDFTAVHQQLMLDEGVMERTPQQMRELGWNQKMIDAAQRIRQVDKEILDRVNQARASMNPPLPPIERRIGHLAGRFLGDFYHTVYELNRDGTRKKAVMMITGTTKWGAQKLADFYAKEHPEWEVSKQEYKGIRKGQNSDRFSGFMEMMSFIANKDKEVAKALDSLDKYNRNAATNYLNQLRHAKAKKAQPGGVVGSEGHKAWVDAKTNAEEGFKGHLAYLDTSARWAEMQKAMGNISKVITDKDVVTQMPNAVRWSTAYTDHALHRNQGFMTDFAQSLLSEVGRVTGVGHTNVTKAVNGLSTTEMRLWMGIGNIPFALKHMLLPFQKMPAMMAYMHTTGGLGPIKQVTAGLKSLSSYFNYLRDKPEDVFEQQAFKYAKDNNVFNVNLDNLSGRIQSGKVRQILGRVSDADFSGPEHAIRGNSFFFYAHLLHDGGMEPKSALSAAEHLSKFLYTDYAPHEAPRATAKAGWIGQLAFQVTRYKTNELSQLGFFGREAFAGKDRAFMDKLVNNAPLMTHLASTLAFTGVTGMLAYKEMDELYSMFRKYVMKDPDNLTALLQRTNAPELVKYGLFSKIGIDPKINEAELLPAPFPTTAAEINQIGLTFNALRYHDAYHAKQLALGVAPSTLRGPLENKMFTSEPATSGPNAGKSLYLNPNTGEGRVWRTPEQQQIRNFGFHTTAETNETNNSYAMSRIEGDHRDLAEHVLTRAKGLIASGSLTAEKAQELGREYAKHQQAGQPEFTAALQSYIMGQHMSQREQMEYKAANDRGMGNSLNIIERNK